MSRRTTILSRPPRSVLPRRARCCLRPVPWWLRLT